MLFLYRFGRARTVFKERIEKREQNKKRKNNLKKRTINNINREYNNYY